MIDNLMFAMFGLASVGLAIFLIIVLLNEKDRNDW